MDVGGVRAGGLVQNNPFTQEMTSHLMNVV